MNKQEAESAFYSSLPGVIRNGEELDRLGAIASKALSEVWEKCALTAIYTRIDELPDELLDVLARDFHVTWYDFNFAAIAKREIIKNAFRVHRLMGTVGGFLRAVRAIFPNSSVEEWQEYGGRPYVYKLLVEAGEKPVYFDDLNAIAAQFAPIRSRMESGAPIVKITHRVLISEAVNGKRYTARRCGTYPNRATRGDVDSGWIAVGASAASAAYATPRCGYKKIF